MNNKFCEYENNHFGCKREWCEHTCPVARYVKWMEGEQTKSRHTSLVQQQMPDEVKRAIMSEVLGVDVQELAKRVKLWGGLDE